MATAIFFNGRRINVPGAYSKIDASALSSVSPSAVGIVALIGTAEGGKPLTVDSEDADLTQAGKVFDRYRSGDLRVASLFAFEPSLDDAIPGGAQRIVAVKVNPATQSQATLKDALNADSVIVKSRDYGLFTAQINIAVASGTLQGKKITIKFEDKTETFDNVGGSPIFSLLYTPGAEGWTIGGGTITGVLQATQVLIAMSKSKTGLSGERAADIPASGPVRIVSSNAGDVGQTVTVYGLLANVPVSETLTLNGTNNVNGVQNFDSVTACKKSAVTAGTVTVSDQVIPTTLFTLAAGTLTRGLVLMTAGFAGSVLTVATSGPTAGENVVIRGRDASGAAIASRFDMSSSPQVGGTVFASIEHWELGDIPGGDTITVSATFAALHSVYTTVQKMVDRLNAQSGLTATALVSNPTTFLMTDADFDATAQSLLTPAKNYYADLFEFIAKLNASSSYVTGTRATSAALVPANTVAAVFLAGGTEGTPTITEWTQAFNLLKKRRVNIIVPLTRDPAVHALLASHLVARAGVLRSEANGYIGIGTAGGAGESKSNIKSQIQVLATRHISAISEEMKRTHPDTGVDTFFPPHYYAAIAAGMQAGGVVGEPLTRKRPLVTDVRRDSSWTVEDDAEEMIEAGLMFSEKVDGLGIRWVRSVTTHLADDNVVFVEMSANAAANHAVFELRTRLDLKVGKRGLAGSAAAIKGLANGILGELIDDEIIVAYRALQVEQIADVFPVSVEIAPVLPINFIPVTVHLVAVRLAA